MLFSSKSRGFFVELNDHAVMVARTSALGTPLTIEEMRECPANDSAALRTLLAEIQARKNSGGYLRAKVGVFPAKRLVRRHTLDPKRIKEAGYIAEVCSQQFKIEQDQFSIAILNATDGTDYDSSTAAGAQKDVLFCGLPAEDLETTQSNLLETGIYPESLELGSVATLGGIVDCLAHSKAKTSVLVLEIEPEATHSFIVTANGIEASRPVAQGLEAMVPLVQKELGLKDEESARKLFYSNTFDFTGMGPLLTKKLLKELQSAIGFYEVQTGQSVGQVVMPRLSPKLQWLDATIANALGISTLRLDVLPWLASRNIVVPSALTSVAREPRWFGLLSLMVQHHNPANAAVSEEKK